MVHREGKPASSLGLGGFLVGMDWHRRRPGGCNAASWQALAGSLTLWIVICLPGPWTQASAADRAATLAICALLFPLAASSAWPVRMLLVGAIWLLGAIQFAYFLAIGSPLDSYFWLTLSTTDWQEVSGFLREHAARLVLQSAGWAVLTGLLGAILLTHPLRGRTIGRWAMLSWFMFGGIALLAALKDEPARFVAKNFGSTYHFRIWNAWNDRSQFARKFRGILPDPPAPPSQPLAQTIVLVIGESSSRSRWQAFGYAKKTNRFLAGRSDIAMFSDVVSNANMTAAAVPMLLAGKSLSALAPADPTLIDLAHRAGFVVTVASNQGRFSAAEDLFGVILHRADHFIQAGQGDFDEVLTGPLQAALARGGRQFIVLHTYGSHHTASKRTPRRYKLLDDEYDNSIAYTDRLLAGWIDLLEKQAGPSLLLYISDHGVETERCHGRYMHGNSTSSYEVPMLLWASKDLRGRAGNRGFQHALQNSRVPYQNTVAFATLADAFGYSALHYPSALQQTLHPPARMAGERSYAEIQPPERCDIAPASWTLPPHEAHRAKEK